MNKVILSGNLCRDIELRKTQNGKSVASVSIGVSRDMKNADGEYETDFINIVVWGASAEYLEKYASKGDLVELVGRWTNRTYEDKNGQQRTISECVVDNIKLLTRKSKEEAPVTPVTPVDDDLPF